LLSIIAHKKLAESCDAVTSKLALQKQKGSKDNITVVVVDLKLHRKFKSKTSGKQNNNSSHQDTRNVEIQAFFLYIKALNLAGQQTYPRQQNFV
jgi:serine/threonine protein phosphatase PrpC